MTDETERALLSRNELGILESIVRDETRSMQESYEAIRQLSAQLEAVAGPSNAEYRTLAERMGRSLRECVASMERLNAALDTISHDAFARLTPAQQARVIPLVVEDGEGILQAIDRVAEREDGDA